MEDHIMKTVKNAVKLLLATLIFSLLAAIGNPGYAQKKGEVLKIGTYDSRVITFAWSRSEYFREQMKKFSSQSDSADKIHDTVRIKELSVQTMSYQHLLHQMVFSNGSASVIMKLIKDQLPELAKKEGVSVILSKWEMNYLNPSIEVVDLTNQIAQLFKPTENIDKMAKEIADNEPVPLEDLSIENEMLDLYCKRFGKK
ncbi:MAG: hypothetical protein ACOYMF_03680 [Bacteroidales bacterium]